MSAESFIYLGYEDNIHYFLHNQSDDDLDEENTFTISSNVYNCMINSEIISIKDTVVVYNFFKDGTILTTVTTHIDGDGYEFNKKKFQKEVLAKMLPKLLQNEYDGSIMVFHYDEDAYYTQVLEDNVFKNIDTSNYVIDEDIIEIKYSITKKPIEY